MPSNSPRTTLVFLFSDNQLVVPKNAALDTGLAILEQLCASLFREYAQQAIQIHQNEDTAHILVDMQKQSIEHDDYVTVGLRELVMEMPAADFQHVARAWQYALFIRTHQFCGRCGSRMDQVSWEMAMHCHVCQHRCYPRVSPCIIVAIRHQHKILLAQGPAQKERGFYSTLAGFVESGESLEQAVHREVFEEVGVKIKNLEYQGSQPWPFPHSLMMGYLAQYDSEEIVVDGKEILDAQWFDIDDLPNVPPPVSIAGKLIAATAKRIRQNDQK